MAPSATMRPMTAAAKMTVRGLLMAALLCASSRIAASPQAPQASSLKPPCVVAPDDEYAYSKEQPVQVGGSPVYGAARQRRYLDFLRGPEGQSIQYKRVGQTRGSDETILDAYELTYQGLDLFGEAEIKRIWTMKSGEPYNGEYPDLFVARVTEDKLFDGLENLRAVAIPNHEALTVDVKLVFNERKPKILK